MEDEESKEVIQPELKYQMEEDLTPTDLKFICSNEKGGFVIFKSKKEGKLFAVYQSKDVHSPRENVIITELSIGKYYSEIPTEEQTKEA